MLASSLINCHFQQIYQICVSIIDGSQVIEINDLDGNLDIDDSSGDLFVKGLLGRAFFEDGSGDFEIEQIGGLKSWQVAPAVYGVKGDFEIDS